MNATKKNAEQALLSKRSQGQVGELKEYSLEVEPDSRTLIPETPLTSYVSLDKFQKVTGAQFLHMSSVNKIF